MKYYAVADDPSELMHYGVKGMKWGQHIFGDKPRSPGFKKAVSKLRASMKNGIKAKQAHWKQNSEMRSVKREAKRESNEAKVARQADARLAEALGAQAAREIRRDRRAARREVNREVRAERREQRNMDRYMQKARHGTLKYKKLRDDQIQSIAERLNLENQARRLSGNETPHMLTRIRRSIGEGVVRGVGSAVAVGIEENARARAKYKAEKKYGTKQAKERLKTQQKMAKREAKANADRDFYEMQAETGERRTFNQTVGPNARKNRMRELNDYKRLQADKEFNKEIRQNVMRGMTQRQKGDTNEDYLARITGDWRDRIGYKSYSPDPKARVRLSTQLKETFGTSPHVSDYRFSYSGQNGYRLRTSNSDTRQSDYDDTPERIERPRFYQSTSAYRAMGTTPPVSRIDSNPRRAARIRRVSSMQARDDFFEDAPKKRKRR